MLTPISTHQSDALARLLEQYKNKPNLTALLNSFNAQWQAIENAGQLFYTQDNILTATGINLDNFGLIIGLSRAGGQSDTAYRQALLAVIFENVSNGQPEQVISIYKLLTGATRVMLSEQSLASLIVMSDVALSDQSFINSLFTQVKIPMPAGVRIDAIGSFDLNNAFSFSDDSTIGGGFGDINDSTVGGILATIYLDYSMGFAFDGNDTTTGGFGTTADPLVGGGFVSV